MRIIETCITAYRNQDQLIGKSHVCRAIHCKPDRRFTITHYNLSKKIIRIHLHPASIINNTRPAKCPLNLTQPHEPLCDIPATQTCNCCLLIVDFSTWNNVKYTVPGTKFPKLAANSMACRISSTFRLLHRLPTTSVLSRPSRLWGAAAVSILRLDGGARCQQHLDHLQVASRSRLRQRPLASVRRAPLEMATGRGKSHELVRRFGSCLVQHF